MIIIVVTVVIVKEAFLYVGAEKEAQGRAQIKAGLLWVK